MHGLTLGYHIGVGHNVTETTIELAVLRTNLPTWSIGLPSNVVQK
jgi:hypothetical protein